MIHRFEALSLLIHMNSVVTGFEWTILCNSQSNIMSPCVKNIRFLQQYSEHGLVIDLQMYSKHIECITKGYCRTVETFCNENNINKIDILKLDVEGCSYEVLKGFGEVLKTVKIMHIETEDVDKSASRPFFEGQVLDPQVADYLKSQGFRCVKKSLCFKSAGRSQWDSVWVRGEDDK